MKITIHIELYFMSKEKEILNIQLSIRHVSIETISGFNGIILRSSMK